MGEEKKERGGELLFKTVFQNSVSDKKNSLGKPTIMLYVTVLYTLTVYLIHNTKLLNIQM